MLLVDSRKRESKEENPLTLLHCKITLKAKLFL